MQYLRLFMLLFLVSCEEEPKNVSDNDPTIYDIDCVEETPHEIYIHLDRPNGADRVR
jgi:hypothetical protein